jgi:hypothetical protein
LASGDPAIFRNRDRFVVPFPNSKYLQGLLDRPEIRGLLSAELVHDEVGRAVVTEGLLLRGGVPHLGAALRRGAVLLGYVLPPVALLIMLFVAWRVLIVRVYSVRASPAAG